LVKNFDVKQFIFIKIPDTTRVLYGVEIFDDPVDTALMPRKLWHIIQWQWT
jgi:hypothetical protein